MSLLFLASCSRLFGPPRLSAPVVREIPYEHTIELRPLDVSVMLMGSMERSVAGTDGVMRPVTTGRLRFIRNGQTLERDFVTEEVFEAHRHPMRVRGRKGSLVLTVFPPGSIAGN